MQAVRRRQEGAFLVLIILTLIVLLGISSLALDLSRVFVLRAEMQKAVDAAALAAAAELDQSENSRERAMDAARHTITADSRFARISELLGEDGLPDEAFSFFCAIGSEYEITPDEDGFAEFCAGASLADEPEKYLATSDGDTRFVRINLDKALTDDDDQYTIDLIFLPVLQLMNINTLEAISLKSMALAGRSSYICNYPPMALCDPFENTGTTFREAMPIGGHIELKQQGSNQWSSGNFGFLDFGGGANALATYLADEGDRGCTPPVITTKPGNMTTRTKAAINTRFDEYQNPGFGGATAYVNWPPAPNIYEYPLDATTAGIDARFGNGDWNFTAHKQALINAGKSVATMPIEWSTTRPKRWDVYNWEIETGNALAIPNPIHLNTDDDGDGDNEDAQGYPLSNPERRLLYVAVLSCENTGLTGGKGSTPIFNPDGFAKIFVIKKAESTPEGKIWGEYVGWGEEQDGSLHIDIQLYE